MFRIKTQINREGLGLKTISPVKAQDIRAKCRYLFKDLLQTDNCFQNDIVFCDFQKEDRVIIHQYVPLTSYMVFLRNVAQISTMSRSVSELHDQWALNHAATVRINED